MLSESESDEDKSNKKKKTKKNTSSEVIETKKDVPESPCFELPLQTEIIEETLSQLPKVDLGEDFDWQEIVNKNPTSASKGEGEEVINNSNQVSDLAWSKGQVPGLEVIF